MRVGGIVLCGGRSSRMGKPKAWLPFGAELMLPRVVRILRQVVDPVVVVAAPGQDVPPLPPDVAIVRDALEGRGPMQGLAAGLAALSGRVDCAYMSSCDVPFLTPAFVRRVIEMAGNHAVCVPHVGGFHHPLAAVYRVDVLSQVTRLLTENCLRPVYLFESVATRELTEHDLKAADPALASLRNLNTPEEYAAALRELAES